MENCVTWMFWERAATKCPHSCTVMIAANTATALATDRGPELSKLPAPVTKESFKNKFVAEDRYRRFHTIR